MKLSPSLLLPCSPSFACIVSSVSDELCVAVENNESRGCYHRICLRPRPVFASGAQYNLSTTMSSGFQSKKRRRGIAANGDEKRLQRVSNVSSASASASASASVYLIPSKYPFHFPASDGGVTAQRAFRWLIAPMEISHFFTSIFEKKPVLITAAQTSSDRFRSFASVQQLRELFVQSRLLYSADVDVTYYDVDSGRQTYNERPRKRAGMEAWKRFTHENCSIRLLRPQEHFDAIWALCSMLETFFGTVVGANTYLTPANSQGFAPHYDDIDAFVCQVSGKKRWRVYSPRPDGYDSLPRRSSVDFTRQDLESVQPVIDTVLEPGDMLYLPRGAVHEAECVCDEKAARPVGMNEETLERTSSLHVTISTCQRCTWADFLEETFKLSLSSVATETLSLRKTLPLRFTDYVGVGYADSNIQQRNSFDKRLNKCIQIVAERYPIDAAADILASRFMSERLPPWDVLGNLNVGNNKSKNGASFDGNQVKLNSWVRLAGRAIARVVMDSKGQFPLLIHCMENSRRAKCAKVDDGIEDQSSKEKIDGQMSCTPDEGLAINFIIKRYPEYVRIRDIPLEKPEERLELVDCLLDMKIVQIGHPRKES